MNTPAFIAIYVSVVALTLALYYASRRYAKRGKGLSRLLLVMAIFVPVAFATIKYSSSPDYFYYLGDATRYAQMSFADYVAQRGYGIAEIARWVVARAGYAVAATPYAFFTIYSLITVSAYYIALAKYRRIFNFTIVQEMLVAAFLFTVFYLYSLSVMDQMAAVPIFLIALTYLAKRRYVAYAALSLLALCFHTSVLIVAPLAWLIFLAYKVKVASTRRILLAVILVAVLTLLFSSGVVSQLIGSSTALSGYDTMYFSSEAGKYNNSTSHPAVYPLFGARLLLLGVLFLFMRNNKQAMTLKGDTKFPLVAYAALSAILFIPSPIALLAGRIGYYFDAFLIMAIALYARGATMESLRAKVILIVYCVLYFVVFYGIANWATLFPLDFIWNHPIG